MRTRNLALALLSCALAFAGCAEFRPEFTVPSPAATVNMVYDDDCDQDIDCATTQPLIHHWIDIKYVTLWGMVSSAPSSLGAPTMRVFQQFYNHQGLFPIGAAIPECAAQQSARWNRAVVVRFDPGDTCTNYADCGAVLRQSLANYINGGGVQNGLVYVITGPLTCEERLRTSPADAVSPLTGAQMEQKYVKEFVLMNGLAPAGKEQNCREDPFSCSAFFANVTSSNGYPPVYVVPFNTGATNVVTQVPLGMLSSNNPSSYAVQFGGGSDTSNDEDPLAVEYAVLGNAGWTQSSNATDQIDVNSGANSWNLSLPSGQAYLTPTDSPSYFESIIESIWFDSQ